MPSMSSVSTVSVATSAPAAASVGSTFDLGDNQKRWVVIGICLNRVLLPVLRSFVGQEICKHYASLRRLSGIDTQVYGPHLTHDGPFKLNYASINNNWGTYKRNERLYDYKVNMAKDLAKLYLEPHMAKFTGFDNTCDLSAVLGILSNASIFLTPGIQPNAKDVRSKVRNEWGHCNFDHWTDSEFKKCIQLMEKLLCCLGLPNADEAKFLTDLGSWKEKGLQLCMGCPVDKDLMAFVSDHVANLEHDVEVMKTSGSDEAQQISCALQNVKLEIAEFHKRVTELDKNMLKVEVRQDVTEESVSQLERKCEGLERKSDETNYRLEELESSLEGLNTPASDLAFLVPTRNSCFCGRDIELSAIAANLKGVTSSCTHTAICGLGGIGKTSLAVEFSWRHKNEYPGGIFWISGENNGVFQSSVREMALEMQIRTMESDFSFTLAKALAWLKKQRQMWCLVIDNLDELEMSEDMRKLLRGKWKQGARGHIIITTRREPREIRKETGIEERFCIELKCFSHEESVQFLRKQTGKTEGEDSEIRELASELGGLPLALDQAGAYIRYLSCSIKDYVEQYRDHKGELLKKMKSQEPHLCTSRDRLAVHTTWLMNFEHITNSYWYEKELRLAATLVMEISAYLGPDDIPNEVINEGLPQVDCPSLVDVLRSPFGRKEVMSLLTKLSLFQQFGTNSYCVHRLVQEVIRNWMDEKRNEDAFNKEFFTKEFSFVSATRFLHHAFVNTRSPVEVCEDFTEDAVFSIENPPSLHLWGKLASHASYLQEHLFDFTAKNEESASALLHTEEMVRLLNEAAISFSVAREKIKAQEIQKQKLEFLTHIKQPPSKETLNILLYFNMPLKDRYYKLISHSMRERPSNREDSAETKSNANELREEGNDAAKREEYKKALDLYTKAIELSSKDYRLYSNRALCYLKLNKPQNALHDCEECLTLKPHYSKALQRKAWALHELVESGSVHLKGCAQATAALAIYFDSNVYNREFIHKMFPDLCYEVVINATELEIVLRNLPQASNKTVLLREGEYCTSLLVIDFDLQVVGLGSGAVLNYKGGFLVSDAKCYLENVTFPSDIPPLVCQGPTAMIHMSHCQISAGFAGCQDYPKCSGGPGCIPASSGKPPCDRTNRIGASQPSGIEGLSGVQFQEGSTGHIYKCRIYHCGGGGAVVHGKGSRLFVRHCDVYRNHQTGLEARSGGQLIASENKVYDNGTAGFLIGPDAGRCLIRSNKIFENQKAGVAVQLKCL